VRRVCHTQVLVGTVAGGSLLLLLVFVLLLRGPYAELEAGNGRLICIHRDSDLWAPSQAYLYQARVDGRATSPLTVCAIYAHGVDPEFEVVQTDGSVVGVVESRDMNEVVALHDFSTGRSWPGVPPSMGWEEGYQVARELLDKLNTESGVVYRLSDRR
jgi:hypothetical protein